MNNDNLLVNEKIISENKSYVNRISSSIIDKMLSNHSMIEKYIKTLNTSPYFWRYDLNEQLQLLSLGIPDARTFGEWQMMENR